MNKTSKDIEIISAPSILGLKPSGVEHLSESLLASGLAENLNTSHPVVHVPILNELYSEKRDQYNCLNTEAIKDFSLTLGKTIKSTIDRGRYPLVLGGDCSILIGVMSALKKLGNFGLIFLDAHADFYEPAESTSGEIADMDLAIVTGRGPEILRNINYLQPYVKDENVIHLGQRDWEETQKYGSQDIRKTSINCFSLKDIESKGIEVIIEKVLHLIKNWKVEGFWIHFDTDVLSDEINPAVDYRLPGGLLFQEVEKLLSSLLLTGLSVGITVTIFNPSLDHSGKISKNISESLGKAFKSL